MFANETVPQNADPVSLVTIVHKRRIPAQAGREGQRGMECFSEEFVLRAGRENRIPFSISFLNF